MLPLPRMNLASCVILLSLFAPMAVSGLVVAAEAVDPGRSQSFHEELVPPPPARSRRVREDISEPTISFSNLQMDLVYTVGDDVQSDEVRIDLFEDRECSVPLMNQETPYIAVDVFSDLTDDGDGLGNRQVCTIHNENISLWCRLFIIIFGVSIQFNSNIFGYAFCSDDRSIHYQPQRHPRFPHHQLHF